MDVLDFILFNTEKIHSTCFLCFKDSKLTVNIDNLMEIHDENSITDNLTLRNVIKYLFASYDILLNQACDVCTDLILKMYVLLKKARIKTESMESVISRINEEIQTKTIEHLDQILIHIKKQESGQFACETIAEEVSEVDCKIVKRKRTTKLKSKKDFILYKNLHYNKSFVCVICSKMFKNTSSLKSHSKCHKKIECPYCSKHLKNNSHYNTHVKNHQKPMKRIVKTQYKCNDCSHKSRNKSDLSSHIFKYHLSIRPFICKICQKSFYRKRNLNEHVLIHTNNKTNTCELCGDQFSCKPSLNNHLKLHSGNKPYKCEICYHNFVTMSRKNEHVKRKHGEKKFTCGKCEKRFCLNKSLNRHIKQCHSIAVTSNVELTDQCGNTVVFKEN